MCVPIVDKSVSFDINWANPWYVQEQCPFAKGAHCHTDRAIVRFRTHDVQFQFIWHAGVHDHSLSPIESAIGSLGLGARDAVIFNVGLHIKTEERYIAQLKLIQGEVSRLLSRPGDQLRALPSINFIETTPQHFHTANGYYIPDINANYTSCYPMDGTIHPTPAYSKFERTTDYKNVYLREMIREHWGGNPRVGLISTAAGLFSQYDAHLMLSQAFLSQGGKELADCTHWCHPSGVHNYLHLQLFNYFRAQWNQSAAATPHV